MATTKISKLTYLETGLSCFLPHSFHFVDRRYLSRGIQVAMSNDHESGMSLIHSPLAYTHNNRKRKNVTEETGLKQLVSCYFNFSLHETNCLKPVSSLYAPSKLCDVTVVVCVLCGFKVVCCRFALVQVRTAQQQPFVVGILKLKVSCGTVTLLESYRRRVRYC